MNTLDLLDEVAAYTDEDLAAMTPGELAEFDQLCAVASARMAREREDDYEAWLPLLFPGMFSAPFGEHHHELWRWVWALERGVAPAEACVCVWNRGGAKSTSAEGAAAACGARRTRGFVMYVCETQHQADDHVGNIGGLLESRIVDMAYPELGRRKVGKYSAGGWRRNRLQTASGLIVEAVGLDTAARGIKIDEFRPDFMVFDDIDNEKDGPGQVDQKIRSMTESLLPAGAKGELAVLVIQNLPNPDGIVAQLAGLANSEADFLRPRIVIGPIPALREFTFEDRDDGGYRIVHGIPTWAGMDLDACQAEIDNIGISAFRKEAQHETDVYEGGPFGHIVFAHCAPEDVPWDDLVRTAVWCDPAVTNTDRSDSMAVQADAIASDGTVFRLRSWEQRSSPVVAIKVAIAYALRYGTRAVGIETDQGGDTWNSVYNEAQAEVRDDLARIERGEPIEGPDEYITALLYVAAHDLVFPMLYEPAQEKAGASQVSKAGRGQEQVAAYETTAVHRIVHVLGTHHVLEAALRRFLLRKPFDLVDAAYWGLRDLINLGGRSQTSARVVARTLPRAVPGQARRTVNAR